MWSYSAARAEPARRAEPLGLLALLGAWLVYTRFFTILQGAHTTLPVCPFYALTGHPCPFCGGTRSYAAMWRGDVLSAFRYHPLGPPLFVATFAAAGYAGWAAVTARKVRVGVPAALWLLAGAVLAASWALKLFWLGN